MPELHLKQPGFTYSALVHLPKTKKELKSLWRQEIQVLFTKTNLIKFVFSMIWLSANQKIWQKKEIRQSDKVFRDKGFKIASDPKYDSYQRDSASMVYKFFDKRSSGKGIAKETKLSLANELHKPIIKKFKKIKIHSSFKHHISGLDLADMQSLSK